MGVTGPATRSAAPPPSWSPAARARARLPVGVGLGVRNGEQAAEVAAFADAVIVGSAFVTAAGPGAPGVRALAADLATGVRRPAAQPA